VKILALDHSVCFDLFSPDEANATSKVNLNESAAKSSIAAATDKDCVNHCKSENYSLKMWLSLKCPSQ
jgi:hypothetical protein